MVQQKFKFICICFLVVHPFDERAEAMVFPVRRNTGLVPRTVQMNYVAFTGSAQRRKTSPIDLN